MLVLFRIVLELIWHVMVCELVSNLMIQLNIQLGELDPTTIEKKYIIW